MINQEEYETLKKRDDKFKWVARDGNTELWVYTKKPYKGMYRWDSVGGNINLLPRRSKYLFQFIQWEDEEPYNIAELIEEYDKNQSYEIFNRQLESLYEESEEIEMKKDIEWAKKEVKDLMTEESQNYPHDEMVEKEVVLGILNQLDEPEVLSEEWIENKKWQAYDPDARTLYWAVTETDLQNLLVPKQDVPVVPTWFDEWWKDVTKGGGNLFHNIELFYDELFSSGTREMYNYISGPDNKKKLLDIIVNELYYVVEEEQKYYVSERDEEYGGFWFLSKNNNGDISIGVNRDWSEVDWDRLKLTEQEIKDYDERYWPFAVPVEEVQND